MLFGVSGSDWEVQSHNALGHGCHNFINADHEAWDGLGYQHLKNRLLRGYDVESWFIHAARTDALGISQAYLVEDLGPGAKGRYLIWQWARDYPSERLSSPPVRKYISSSM
jgi:hypothetical protein